jgi:hypothetical protein
MKFTEDNVRQSAIYKQLIASDYYDDFKTEEIVKELLMIPEGSQRGDLALNESFLWRATPQGHEYWSDIYDRIYK